MSNDNDNKEETVLTEVDIDEGNEEEAGEEQAKEQAMAAAAQAAHEAAIQTRLDVTASLLQHWTDSEKQLFIDTLHTSNAYSTVTTIHLSGRDLETVLSAAQIESIVDAIGNMYHVTDLFVFQGDSTVLTADLLAKHLPPNLTVLMLWHLTSTPESLACALRQHANLCRVTLNFPCSYKKHHQLEWASLDVYAMAFCSMQHLEVLQIRCVTSESSIKHGRSNTFDRPVHVTQEDSIITPEALALLLNSTTIQHLYLENCGLLDDHVDVMAAELPHNKTLVSLDVQHNNQFTEDVWYTTGRLLPNMPPQLTSLDISCSAAPNMSDEAGRALAAGMAHNTTLINLELEGTYLHYANEFDIPQGHSQKEWMADIIHQLRINRANVAASDHAKNSLADNGNDSNQQRPWAKSKLDYSQPRAPPNPVSPPTPTATDRLVGAVLTNGRLPQTAAEALDEIHANAANFVVALTSVSDHVGGLYHFVRKYPTHVSSLRAVANAQDDNGEYMSSGGGPYSTRTTTTTSPEAIP